MSRNIQQFHKPCENITYNQSMDEKLIITSYNKQELAFLLKSNRLIEVYPLDSASKVNAIYIGKVKNVIKNLNACFVEIADNTLCYLPFTETKHPYLLNRRYDGRLIQGDELLVQVQRDAQKTKQAALTCNVTLQNDYFVFAVGNTKAGISAKLSTEQRASISQLLELHSIIDAKGFLIQNPFLPNHGCIIRTKAADLLKEDPAYFIDNFLKAYETFQQLFETSKHRTCFSCIQPPPNPYKAILSHFRAGEYNEVLTDIPDTYMSLIGHIEGLRFYNDNNFPLSKLYSLESKLQEALSKTIWLKSGAYLIIEQTECLTTIDVNSGKKIKGTQIDETIWEINTEAAKEAALQIRLRNLSGIIIIDFINMKDKTNEEILLKMMKELTATDIVPVNIVDITPLGLMEITRKKVCASLKEQLKSND